MRFAELSSARVAIWGFGREGRAALTVLRKRFPKKVITLLCSSDEAKQAQVLHDERLEVQTRPLDGALLAQFDAVIKSPGISPYQPIIQQAQALGVRFTSSTALWFAEHPRARTICVTGTKGKSTTSALIAHILRKSGYCIGLAGNIGLPMLELCDVSKAVDWWVIELSSFQTAELVGDIDVALITNLYPEHLDWHGNVENYYRDKLVISKLAQHLVVNAGQPELISRSAAHTQRTTYGTTEGWHCFNNAIYFGAEHCLERSEIPLLGVHNAHNVCAALEAIDAAGFNARSLIGHVKSFRALPHRLQSLGFQADVEYVNDSISTTPHASLAALETFGGRAVTLILGGHDRGIDWSFMVEQLALHPPYAVVTQGTNGPGIAHLLRETAQAHKFVLREAGDLAAAVAIARELTPCTGIVLLSPGAPSFDQFRDYTERGRTFARLAGFDADAIVQIEGLGVA